METQVAPRSTSRDQRSPKDNFTALVVATAEREIVSLFGSENGRAAAARVALAFRAAANTAKDPSAFYDCSPQSVGAALATSAFTQIMPGGPFPGCWLIPKAVNKVQTLNWWINHRGIKTLARRAGQGIEAIPYFAGDEVVIRRGKDWSVDVIEGDAPDRDSFAALDGFVYFVTDLETGHLLAARKVSKALIVKRKAKGQGGSVWSEWPMEMAEKTVIKYAAGRGDVFFDDVGNMALSREAEAIDVPHETVSRAPVSSAVRAIADAGRVNDEVPEQREREAIEQEHAQDAEPERRARASRTDIDRTIAAGASFGVTRANMEERVQRSADVWDAQDLVAINAMLAQARSAKKPATVDEEGA